MGYRVEELQSRDRSLEVLTLCWLLSLTLMTLMFWHGPFSLELQALLAIAVQGVGGYSLYRGALGALRTRVGNMDLLVALGSTSALAYSLLSFWGLLPGEPFFETSAFLVTFVRTGKFLEEWVRARALKSLRELLSLQTLKARVLKEGREEEKSPQEVFVGDILLLRTGDVVPVDCVLLEGSLEVEESLLTGESTPVKKGQGDRLLSGSSVVSGFGRARAEKTFLGSSANLLAKLVEETLSKKPRLQRLADQLSHHFVQVVLLLSVAVFLLWYLKTGEVRTALNFALSVLVVSCPCAFGIA
ncbi:MAG: HAD-IC family P-type ATPase, partial [Aquificaceae bacterium]|nr:HAD-IC family P-type ATPase [Aquificaceae bacterium]